MGTSSARHRRRAIPEGTYRRQSGDAVQAAERDEPGAMKALIELKLSANARFQDRPGACKLIETAVSRGDRTMAQRLADCRAN
jgi:hypothetical protein